MFRLDGLPSNCLFADEISTLDVRACQCEQSRDGFLSALLSQKGHHETHKRSALRHGKGDRPEAIVLLRSEPAGGVEILGLPIAVGYL